MKKIVFLLVLVMGVVVYASAEKRTYYVVSSLENPDEDVRGQYSIDVENKTFQFGHDGSSPVRNYKKKGNVETFGTWDNELEAISHEITIETGDEQTTMKFKRFDGRKYGYVVSTTEPVRVASPKQAKSPKKATVESKDNIVDRSKSKAKNLLKKGKGLLK